MQALLTRLRSQIPAPPQSLQMFLRGLCSQMLVPPQSLQALLWRLCSQMLAPPQSLYSPLMRLCWQIPAPPQFLNLLEETWGARGSHADFGTELVSDPYQVTKLTIFRNQSFSNNLVLCPGHN